MEMIVAGNRCINFGGNHLFWKNIIGGFGDSLAVL